MSIIYKGQLEVISYNPNQTIRLGTRLGKLLKTNDTICLQGKIGSGKTLFASGIGHGWSTQYPVTSPTFSLVHQHQRDMDDQILYHLDCYRLSDTLYKNDKSNLSEIFDSQAIFIIEWPENIKDILPIEYLWIDLHIVEETRRNILFTCKGDYYLDLIEAFHKSSFHN